MARKPRAAPPARPKARSRSQAARSATWKLEDAKAKFSEVVRRAHADGPQYVTVRGKPAVAVIDVAELARFLPAPAAEAPLVDFLESLHLETLDLSRERDLGRDPAL